MAGVRSLPEPPEERYAYDRRYDDHPLPPTWFDHRPTDGDRPRRRAPHADGGVESGKPTALSRSFPKTCSPMAANALFGMVPGLNG